AAVKAVFGDRAKKLIFGSTKSMTGHLLGAAGAFEAGVCALVVQTGIIPPTTNQFTPDPACDLDSAPNKAVKRDVDVALSNSFGFGGHNVRSEEHTSELQSRFDLVCRLLLEKKNKNKKAIPLQTKQHTT